MSSIRLDRVAFAYPSSPPLLAGVELHFTRGFTGIVGANGAGKSTLLALISSALVPTSGRVIRDVAPTVVAQTLDDRPAIVDELAARDDADAGRWCAMLALDRGDALARWPTLSPGERRRWQLAAALAAEPDAMLLDEPTNHIDARGRALIVGALRRYRGIALIASHDRTLLDELTTATVLVEAGTARRYAGHYSAARDTWLAERAHATDVRRAAIATADTAERALHRARADARAADARRPASARKKGPRDHDATTLVRNNVIARGAASASRRAEVARRSLETARDAIPAAAHDKPLGRSIFVDYERCPRRFVLDQVAATDRVHVTGDNGAGKSTLLAAMLRACTLPRERVLALPQELAPDDVRAVLADVRALAADDRSRVMSLVAALGVPPDRVLASASPSPGEARKLALALGLGRRAWLVVLDEPTNHLDLPSVERLEAALAAYPGALVLVSHDTRFASALTTSRWQVRDGRVVT
jgi:ATPase subunit of ABC transporter with duplicated ATPase domains